MGQNLSVQVSSAEQRPAPLFITQPATEVFSKKLGKEQLDANPGAELSFL